MDTLHAPESLPSRHHVENLLAEKNKSNSNFRDTLEKHSHREIGNLIGIEIPEFITINFHDESDTEIHLVIPRGSHLNLRELDAIAGGHADMWCRSCQVSQCEHQQGIRY